MVLEFLEDHDGEGADGAEGAGDEPEAAVLLLAGSFCDGEFFGAGGEGSEEVSGDWR